MRVWVRDGCVDVDEDGSVVERVERVERVEERMASTQMASGVERSESVQREDEDVDADDGVWGLGIWRS